MAGAVLWIQEDRVQPLLTPPSSPPPGLHMSWAGQPIRGYAETVTSHVSDCNTRPSFTIVLYPTVGRPWRPPAKGRVALAVSGAWAPQMPRVPIRFSNVLGRPLMLARDIQETVPAPGSVTWKSFAFKFDPRKERNIEVVFGANWLSPRDKHSCWLSLPALLGGGESLVVANDAIDRPEWARDQRGAPLYSAENQLQTDGEMTLANPTNSIPLPSELGNHTWSCAAGSELGTSCEAFVSLERPGAETTRVRELSQWTLAEGVLVAFIGALVLPLGHVLLQLARLPRWPRRHRCNSRPTRDPDR